MQSLQMLPAHFHGSTTEGISLHERMRKQQQQQQQQQQQNTNTLTDKKHTYS